MPAEAGSSSPSAKVEEALRVIRDVDSMVRRLPAAKRSREGARGGDLSALEEEVRLPSEEQRRRARCDYGAGTVTSTSRKITISTLGRLLEFREHKENIYRKLHLAESSVRKPELFRSKRYPRRGMPSSVPGWHRPPDRGQELASLAAKHEPCHGHDWEAGYTRSSEKAASGRASYVVSDGRARPG